MKGETKPASGLRNEVLLEEVEGWGVDWVIEDWERGFLDERYWEGRAKRRKGG